MLSSIDSLLSSELVLPKPRLLCYGSYQLLHFAAIQQQCTSQGHFRHLLLLIIALYCIIYIYTHGIMDAVIVDMGESYWIFGSGPNSEVRHRTHVCLLTFCWQGVRGVLPYSTYYDGTHRIYIRVLRGVPRIARFEVYHGTRRIFVRVYCVMFQGTATVA